MFYVYKIENLVNKKNYIGYTTNPKQRWQRHLLNAKESKTERHKLIHKAIKKYGVDNFQLIILGISDSHQDILIAEKFFIKYFRSNVYTYGSKFGYNLTDGGDSVYGMRHSEETRSKMSKSQIGRKHSEETKKKISQSNIGKHLGPSKETKEKIAKILRANPSRLGAILSEETKQKIGRSNSGKIRSETNREKISDGLKLSYQNNERPRAMARLTEAQVLEIKTLLSEGQKVAKISQNFGISKSHIYDIKNGKKWGHLSKMSD